MKVKFFLVFFVLLFLLNNVMAEDIAYVLKNPTSPDSALINSINELSIEIGYTLTYKLIDDSAVTTTDFSKYRVILIGDELINNVPVNNYKSMILNPDYYDFCSSNVGSVSSSQPLSIYNGWGNSITEGLPVKTTSYISGGSVPIYYLKSLSSECNKVSSLYNYLTEYVVVSKDNPRRVFFGMTKTSYWTTETQQLFKNSLKWILQGDDMDGDGYFAGDDCNDNDEDKWQYLEGHIDNDRDGFGTGNLIDVCSGDYLPMGYADNNEDCDDDNSNVNPEARELLYNNVDDNCNGYDWADYDGDGYCKEGYNITNKDLQCSLETSSVGTDCKDTDNTYNPGSSDIDKNCRNEPPVFNGIIEDVTFDEDKNQINIINLNNYFSDVDSILSFSISGNNHINSTIINGLVSFYPEKNWFGTEIIIFSGTDGKTIINSNQVSIEVVDSNEPPEFGNISCFTDILEDIEYNCEIIATDSENNPFNFSIANENKLYCYIEDNVITYKPYPDYFGVASCIIRASDVYGYNEYLLRVNVQNVNDAPIILTYNPQTNPRMLNNTNQVFNITITNLDDDSITVNWFLNNQNVSSGNIYTFNANKGSYNLTAIADDGQLSAFHFWDVFVGFAEELTCSEAKGFVCDSTQVCNGNLLGVTDSNACCNIACSDKPPAFKDISKQCKNKSNNLEIIFKDITSMDSFIIGETTSRKIQIYNNANISQDVILDIYVYDLSDDEVITRQKYSFNMDKKTNKVQSFDVEFPWKIDEDNKFAIFANVRGNGDEDYCNSDYIRIAPERMLNSIIIEQKSVDKTELSCGDSFNLYTKLRNIGSDEQNIVLEIDNSFLKIDEEIDEIELESYGRDDSWSDSITLTIPDNAKAGNYTIRINALANNNTRVYEDLKISLGECLIESSSSTKIGLIKLTNSNDLQLFQDPKNLKLVLWNSMIVFVVLSFLLFTVVYKGIQRKRTKKKLEKEITKIIKRKNGKSSHKKSAKHKKKR